MGARPPGDDTSDTTRTLRDEIVGPPRPSRRAQFCAVAFGALLVASLVITALTDVEVSPGLMLTNAGLMVLCGFAELLDPRQRRFVIALRLAGAGVSVLGLVLLLL
ncbi:hypothetical protein BSP109_00156 [Brevibacterium sp. Mu109]|uniref:hypothetical protein n=1 Tax=Brevibacterium sp. Mu109 TaxID=1255669 RepID=UPI000C668104|nr:hypothetical protein [Brevibacterium sp. Mu109]SMX65064.1 hypothetical protein BSP109_00156 [Brevibacterium sp. Mu109]